MFQRVGRPRFNRLGGAGANFFNVDNFFSGAAFQINMKNAVAGDNGLVFFRSDDSAIGVIAAGEIMAFKIDCQGVASIGVNRVDGVRNNVLIAGIDIDDDCDKATLPAVVINYALGKVGAQPLGHSTLLPVKGGGFTYGVPLPVSK
ncbi:MAG: hypothetical protein HN423_06650 [Alphaproteobacteria bacterium]|nr:hypothetical protein [Alphaproteobacteria bacterium]